MAKIIPINQEIIDSFKEFQSFIDEHFLSLSFEERAKKFKDYIELKKIYDHLINKALIKR